jgi:ribosomal protein L34
VRTSPCIHSSESPPRTARGQLIRPLTPWALLVRNSFHYFRTRMARHAGREISLLLLFTRRTAQVIP